ncbi:beta-lactamase family protein [Qipengyuania sp. 1NDH17]|uniref:Beta-lactamase family protein n=1 Tax=Qipengyuania polymorpha TaxID=2867234 RepID=A0ABS7IUJ2_9SPHN|nr:serine hydrolase domain-containing protein [Qipengyuania polymorpha]MBX7457071.1 beta-lactamase family protein [Qipengyuania polymorpha]
MKLRQFSAAALLFLASTPLAAQIDDVPVSHSDYQFGDEAHLDRRIEQSAIEYGIVGGAVAAARGDRTLYLRGFGMADREAGLDATADTVFPMASVTKFITAAAIMLLVDEGKLDLETPVNSYLGNDGVRPTYGREEEITLGRVMSHTAGLPFLYEPIYADENRVRPSFAELMQEHGYTILPPGVSSEYSNLGYEILAEIIRRQSGMAYEDFIRTRLFEPLGMASAYIHTGRERPPGTAQRYMADGSIVPGVDTSHPGAANAFMSVRDMIRFGQFWLRAYRGESTLMSQHAARLMITNDQGEEGKGAAHGLWPEEYPAETLYVSHGGGMAGAKTRLAILPELGLVIAVAINEGNATAEAVLGEEMIRSFETQSNLYWRSPKVPEALEGYWSGTIGGNGPVAHLTLDFRNPLQPRASLDGRDVLVRSVGGDGPFKIRLDAQLEGVGFGVTHDLRLRLWNIDGQLVGEVKQQAIGQRDRDNPGKGFWVRMSEAG